MAVHLNIHTSFDLLQSTVRINELVDAAVADGQRALAITDTNVLFGVQAFYHACKDVGIKPIIGMTVYVTDGIDAFETVLLAKNNEGFNHLMKLSSKIQLKSLDSISAAMLVEYSNHLIKIYRHLPEHLEYLLDLEDSYVSHESTLNTENKVLMRPVKYIRTDGFSDLQVLQAIDANQKLTLETLDLTTGTDYFRSMDELEATDCSRVAIGHTEKIAEMCQVDLSRKIHKLPKFSTPDGQSSDEYLKTFIDAGKSKIADFDARYEERLAYEYDIITRMNFSDYFLIVSDLIRFAKSKGILVGPGRGSAAGSLISYLLDITMIDPIEHDLLFERFLNPERVTLPDIDIDFEDTRREEVIQYCIDKYGAYNISGIVTFGHLSARAVMRDVGRILQFSESDLKFVSHVMPRKNGITLDEVMEEEAFSTFINQDKRHQKWYKIARQLEGLERHTSTHAAGIIIHDQLLTDYVPLIKGETINLTQWTMNEVEAVGLLKIDFLGLRNLSIIQRVLKKEHLKLTTDSIEYNDEKVYQHLSNADTTGIFQLESEGIRQVLRRLQPQNFEDIVAVLSLYRPGPMEQIPIYIDRRHGASFEYIHPDLEPILNKTYGVIVYQEQIMQIANQFAGFSLGEADNLRRAMSKKYRDVLERERAHFIEGSINNGYEEETAAEIYDLILKFANYGFNRAHAVAYAQVSYFMMYLKVNYPAPFYAAIMTNVIGVEAKLSQLVKELKTRHIPYIGPSINRSSWYFDSQNGEIIMSLGMIKGIGYRTVVEIVETRRNGPYKDIYDFCSRLPKRILSRTSLEALIMVGCFDEFNVNRATLLASLDDILATVQDGTDDRFLEALGFNLKKQYIERPEMNDELKARYEFEHLGFFLTKHPIERMFEAHLYLPLYSVQNAKNHQWILGIISEFKEIRTKKGQLMAFATLTDGIGILELVIFPDVYRQLKDTIAKDSVVVVNGKFDTEKKLIVNRADLFDTFKSQYLKEIKELYVLKKPDIQLEQGDIALYFYHIDSGVKELIGHINQQSVNKLLEIYPPEYIRVI